MGCRATRPADASFDRVLCGHAIFFFPDAAKDSFAFCAWRMAASRSSPGISIGSGRHSNLTNPAQLGNQGRLTCQLTLWTD